MHIKIDEILSAKIPAIMGNTAKNNVPILLTLAEGGPMIKYGLYKEIGGTSSTIGRRVDDLKSRGYIAPAGSRFAFRGRQQPETTYGLTWKGFIACLYFQRCRRNFVHILKVNPLLEIPEKDVVLTIFNKIFDEEYFDLVLYSLFCGYVLSGAPPIEIISEAALIGWVEPIISAAPHFEIKKEKTVNLFTLLDNPKILEYVKEKIVPKIAEYKNQTYETYKLLSFFDVVGQSVLELNVEDKPSKVVEELIEKLLASSEDSS